MMKANKGGPPEWLSTHPQEIVELKKWRKHYRKVVPLYEETINHKEQ
ncbi:MAG: hypothetical protein CM15mP58_09370 [Burkholderiaceae bacterium]|nr:MAG: hypothetical protein CM15mP58_09370 [Burkholderiaceae bacterium]